MRVIFQGPDREESFQATTIDINGYGSLRVNGKEVAYCSPDHAEWFVHSDKLGYYTTVIIEP